MPSTKPSTKPRGASQEYNQRAEGDQDVGQNLSSASSSWDEVRYSFSHFIPKAWLALCPGAWAHPLDLEAFLSLKQEGLDNADTMNPYVNEPGKSKKGEGETDSVKVKGTVRPGRPQV
ncbi:unnamed protein product [Penicillium discolor]